jgi:hypothetical protein
MINAIEKQARDTSLFYGVAAKKEAKYLLLM